MGKMSIQDAYTKGYEDGRNDAIAQMRDLVARASKLEAGTVVVMPESCDGCGKKLDQGPGTIFVKKGIAE